LTRASPSSTRRLIESYEWDFDGDGTFDRTTSEPGATHTYEAEFDGVVRVTD
jgi:PKD repeat protein